MIESVPDIDLVEPARDGPWLWVFAALLWAAFFGLLYAAVLLGDTLVDLGHALMGGY